MEGKHLGKTNIYLPSVDSTNCEIFRLIKTYSFPEGMVLWTDHQYAGRGLENTKWESEKGMNIIASFLFYPRFLTPEKQFYLIKTFSLGTCDAVNNILQDNYKVEIKWPNDIFINGRKIAGILTENIIQGSMIKYTVVGIGINANQTRFSSFQSTATSLKLLTGENHNIQECINILSDKVQKRYMMLKSNLQTRLDNDYLSSLYRYLEKADYRTEDKSFEATIRGIDKYGKLLLQHTDGSIEAYDFKEVKFVD